MAMLEINAPDVIVTTVGELEPTTHFMDGTGCPMIRAGDPDDDMCPAITADGALWWYSGDELAIVGAHVALRAAPDTSVPTVVGSAMVALVGERVTVAEVMTRESWVPGDEEAVGKCGRVGYISEDDPTLAKVTLDEPLANEETWVYATAVRPAPEDDDDEDPKVGGHSRAEFLSALGLPEDDDDEETVVTGDALAKYVKERCTVHRVTEESTLRECGDEEAEGRMGIVRHVNGHRKPSLARVDLDNPLPNGETWVQAVSIRPI